MATHPLEVRNRDGSGGVFELIQQNPVPNVTLTPLFRAGFHSLALLGLLLAPCFAAFAASSRAPNIILFLIDDQDKPSIGAYGGKTVILPDASDAKQPDASRKESRKADRKKKKSK